MTLVSTAEDGAPCSAGTLDQRVNILAALRAHNRTLSDGHADEWTRGVALLLPALVSAQQCQ